jgi:hypothetical protein
VSAICVLHARVLSAELALYAVLLGYPTAYIKTCKQDVDNNVRTTANFQRWQSTLELFTSVMVLLHTRAHTLQLCTISCSLLVLSVASA